MRNWRKEEVLKIIFHEFLLDGDHACREGDDHRSRIVHMHASTPVCSGHDFREHNEPVALILIQMQAKQESK